MYGLKPWIISNKSTTHFISQVLSYHKISESYKPFIVAIFQDQEPKTYN